MLARLRKLALLVLFVAVLACGITAWLSVRLVTAPFLASGAADVQISELGLGERLITYRMPNPDDTWLTPVARRLSNSGWSLPDERHHWGDTENYIPVYTRESRIWFVRLRERAELLGDRRFARIRVSYSITTQW